MMLLGLPCSKHQSKELNRRKKSVSFEETFHGGFGLPPDTYKRRDLIRFDVVVVATGYCCVIATWQGLFFELRPGY